MDRRRLLLQRHSEKLLVELRRAVKVGDTHRDMVYGDGFELGLLRRRLRAADQRSEGKGELAAGYKAALEIGKHFFDDLLHDFLSKSSEIILGKIPASGNPRICEFPLKYVFSFAARFLHN